jgi:hypothetical protein
MQRREGSEGQDERVFRCRTVVLSRLKQQSESSSEREKSERRDLLLSLRLAPTT